MFDDLKARVSDVIAHQTISSFAIRRNDRSDNLVVLVKRVLSVPRHELKRAERCEPLSKTSRDRSDTGIVCTLINKLVKLIVETGEVLLAISDLLLATGVQDLKPALLNRRHAHCAQARAETFKLGQCFEHVVELLDVYPRNSNSLSGSHLYQTCTTEAPERLANRRSRHAELAADTRLVEPRTRLDRPGENVLDERFENLVRQCHGGIGSDK
jgi:hypothetical protein